MIVKHDTVEPFDFDGLTIFDFTAGKSTSSSIAEIVSPPRSRHRMAYSERSDKYYYVIRGHISFTLGDNEFELSTGDCCLVPKETRFSYTNHSRETAKLLVIHTPPFEPNFERFADSV